MQKQPEPPTTAQLIEWIDGQLKDPTLRGSYREIATSIRAQLIAAQEMRNQLPEGMQHCTIRFLECEVGHGRLTATNWVQYGCMKCEIDKLMLAAQEMKKALEAIATNVLQSEDANYARKFAQLHIAKATEAGIE